MWSLTTILRTSGDYRVNSRKSSGAALVKLSGGGRESMMRRGGSLRVSAPAILHRKQCRRPVPEHLHRPNSGR